MTTEDINVLVDTHVMLTRFRPTNTFGRGKAPPYSSSMNAALDVIDQMQSEGYGVKLLSENNTQYFAAFFLAGFPVKYCEGNSFAEATCFAALIAKGIHL